jgi:hypothetical protein
MNTKCLFSTIAFICLTSLLLVQPGFAEAAYKPVIVAEAVVSQEEGRYQGWPSIAKLPNGRLMVVYSGDRDWHVCPWGKIRMVLSDDSGQTWSEPTTIANTPLDDRDVGILVTKEGTLLVTWFTSLAFMDQRSQFYERRYAQYADHGEKLTAEIKQQWLGSFAIRSEDGGETWGEPLRIPFHTPHGPIQLRDGRILMVSGSGVAESLDDGLTWKVVSRFRTGYGRLSEVFPVERGDGEILVLSRARRLRQFGSSDGGRTWSIPFETNMRGYPPHMVQLENGWLVAVYGRRDELPMGQFASISRDGGETWETENEITLSIADKHPGTREELGYPPSWDLGYPASVILDDGSIWTVYYQVDEDGEWPSIKGTHWKIDILDTSASKVAFRHMEQVADLSRENLIHLNVDFSRYQLGSVKGQPEGTVAGWSGGDSWQGEVVSLNSDRAGIQALQVSSATGGASGRGSFPICPGAPQAPNQSLSLESAGKMYWSVDLLAPSKESGVDLIMSDTSPGNLGQTGFRLSLNTTSRPVSFAASVRETGGVAKSTMVNSIFIPDQNIWYRFEFEITQSHVPGAGLFSVFVSSKGEGRKPILTDQPYEFVATQLPTLFVVPTNTRDAADGIQMNHIRIISGLSQFPQYDFL